MMNEKINSTVYKLLNDLKYSTLPVDVHEIARRLGYSVRNYSQCKSLIKRLGFEKYTDNFQGISFKYDNIFYILIFLSSYCKLQRYTKKSSLPIGGRINIRSF